MGMTKSLVVFDLDFTLWDAGGLWCDCTNPPYHQLPDGRVFDSADREIRLYEDVLDILEMLENRGLQIALASRTSAPSWANRLTKLLGIDPFIQYREIYPGSKIQHLNNIARDSAITFGDMVFFDDEHRNIHDAKGIGVESIHVPNGVNYEMVLSAIT